MPWMPVERAGQLGGNSVGAGICKHVQTFTRMDVGQASSLLGGFGGGFGCRKNIFRV